MTNYYLGGYYLILQEPVEYWHEEIKIINSASSCFNNHLLNTWSFSRTADDHLRIEKIKQLYSIDNEMVASIRNWAVQASSSKRVGWPNVFIDLETLLEFKNTFFSHLPDLKIFAVYFDETALGKLRSILAPTTDWYPYGLYLNANKRVPETSQPDQTLLGYDLIGIEDGNFHTFYCHGISQNLARQFDLELNQYGLFNDSNRWKDVLEYINLENAPVEPVPWLVCKVKRCHNY